MVTIHFLNNLLFTQADVKFVRRPASRFKKNYCPCKNIIKNGTFSSVTLYTHTAVYLLEMFAYTYQGTRESRPQTCTHLLGSSPSPTSP